MRSSAVLDASARVLRLRTLAGILIGLAALSIASPAAAQQATPAAAPAPRSAWATRGAATVRQAAGRLDQLQRQSAMAGRRTATPRPSSTAAPAIQLAPALSGTMQHLLVPVQFSGDTLTLDAAAVRERAYGTAEGNPASVGTYFYDASNGTLQIAGATLPAMAVPSTMATYAAGPLDVFLRDVLQQLDSTVSVSSFGDALDPANRIPLVVLLVPGSDAACAADSAQLLGHRGTVTAALGAPFTTSSLGPDGRPVTIDDYVVYPVGACDDPAQPAPTVPLVRATAEVLGLPALEVRNQGVWSGGLVGAWDLMGTGDRVTVTQPSRLSAWSRAMLGWATVDTLPLPVGMDTLSVSVAPLTTSERVYALPFGATSEIVLAEVRRPDLLETAVPGDGGLLLWYVNPARVVAELSEGQGLNRDLAAPSVALLSADGRDDLRTAVNAWDATDPWGTTDGPTVLDSISYPPLRSAVAAVAPQWRLIDIREGFGGAVAFRMIAPAGDASVTYTLANRWLPAVDGGASIATALSLMPAVPENAYLQWQLAADVDTTLAAVALAWDGALQVRTVLREDDDTLAVPLTIDVSIDGRAPVTVHDTLRLPIRGLLTQRALVTPESFPTLDAGVRQQVTMSDANVLPDGYTGQWRVAGADSVLGATISLDGVLTFEPRMRLGDTTVTLTIERERMSATDTTRGAWVIGRTYAVRVRGLAEVGVAQLVSALLDPAANPLSPAQAQQYDLLGNRNGAFDLGDLTKLVRSGRFSLTAADRQALTTAGLAALLSTP